MSYAASTRSLLLVMIAASALALGFILFVPPLPQDPGYHAFHAQCEWAGIPHAELVLTNIFFLCAAARGSAAIAAARRRGTGIPELLPWITATVGVFLTAFGSAWYHLAPSNETLVFDRLPMTIAFAGLTAGAIKECLGVKAALATLVVMLPLGIASVLAWHASELRGHGDLRFYGLIQFLPLLVLPLIFWMTRPRCTGLGAFLIALLCYVAAKVLEGLDAQLGHALLFSGHGWKHMLAAGAAATLLTFPARARALPALGDALCARIVKVQKEDLFGVVARADLAGTPVALRDIRSARWWTKPIATLLFWNEEVALAALHDTDKKHLPTLVGRARGMLLRSWISGLPLMDAPPPTVEAFVEARALLRKLRRLGVTHNDTHKPPNWIVLEDGSLALIDFQLARVHVRRGPFFRMLAREDLRHLLKQQQRFRPGSLTPRGLSLLRNKAPTARLWRALAKPLYVLVTRKLLKWQDREGRG